MTCTKLSSITEWEDVKKSYFGTKSILLLKKSDKSTVSFVAEKFVDMWSREVDTDIVECFKIDVIAAKELSAKIANEFEIKHESPQLIWIRPDGAIGWTGHHHEISLERLNMLNLRMHKTKKER